MKKYFNFIKENQQEDLSSKQSEIVYTVANYVKKKADYDIYEYKEPFKVIKDTGENFLGKLYLTTENRALRFNFLGDLLVCIDFWTDFKFDYEKITNNPNFTMDIEGSIQDYLQDVVDFVNGEFFQVTEKKSENPVKKAATESVVLKSITISPNVLNFDIDVFDAIKYFTMQVAYGQSNSLVVSGLPGLGKTSEVEEALETSRVEWVSYKGDITVSGLYETLFINRQKLIVFDDCDSVFSKKNEESVNMLKAALDTKKKREISRVLKTSYDSTGMSDAEMQKIFDEKGQLPRTFNYNGRIIIITNVPGENIDEALISRGLHVDVDLTIEQILARMRKLMDKLFPNYSREKKEETLEFMNYLISNYESKFPLNIRTLIHCINIRISNDFLMDVGGERVPVWQLLVKSYLLKK